MSVFDTLQKWQGELPPSTYLSRRAWCEVKYTPKGETEEKDISEELIQCAVKPRPSGLGI